MLFCRFGITTQPFWGSAAHRSRKRQRTPLFGAQNLFRERVSRNQDPRGIAWLMDARTAVALLLLKVHGGIGFLVAAGSRLHFRNPILRFDFVAAVFAEYATFG